MRKKMEKIGRKLTPAEIRQVADLVYRRLVRELQRERQRRGRD